MNHPIKKFSGVVIGLTLVGLALQLCILKAVVNPTAKSCASVASLTIDGGSLFSESAHTPFSQTDQVTLAGEERAGEQIDMDDDASASLHHSQSSLPAHKANLWLAPSGYLPNNSGRSLRERGPPVPSI